MKTAKDVGLYIKRLREEKGLTQEQLGKIVGVQKAAVQKWESGAIKNLKRDVIRDLSNYFKVEPASFVQQEKEGKTNPTKQKAINIVENDEDVQIVVNALEGLTKAQRKAVIKMSLDNIKHIKSLNEEDDKK